jgi:hypothetical protein
MNTLTKVLIGAGVAVAAYQGWKIISKPKGEPKSNATGGNPIPTFKYKKNEGKVYKMFGTGFDAKWVRLNDAQQPKPMDWYNLNGKWVWTKWNGKLDTATIPNKYILA